jgi:hypothetical protein
MMFKDWKASMHVSHSDIVKLLCGTKDSLSYNVSCSRGLAEVERSCAFERE